MLTHKDFDFNSMRSKTLNELTKEEKEYISKYVSMKIPHQFYQYVVSYVKIDAYSDSSKKASVLGIYTTFGEAYDEMVEFFNKCWNGSKYKFYIKEDEKSESERCLECDIICESCADVCPNRANVVIDFNQRKQILHIDRLCNECGNCETFCPYSSAPYKEKLTLFANKKVAKTYLCVTPITLSVINFAT